MLRSFLLAACALLATTSLLADDEDAKRKEFRALAGRWELCRFQSRGSAFSVGVPPPVLVLDADGKGTLFFPKQGERQDFVYTVDPSRTPKQITMMHANEAKKGEQVFGIYKIEGNRLYHCYPPPESPEEQRPRDFETGGTNATLSTYEKVEVKKSS
jgi:uncharacterized protein (TIGR03067 family)